MSKNKQVDYSVGVEFRHPDSETVYYVTTESDAENLIRSGWVMVPPPKTVKKEGGK